MLDGSNGVLVNICEKKTVRSAVRRPALKQQDPSVIHARVDTREISEKNPRALRVTSPKRNCSGLNLKNVVCHDACRPQVQLGFLVAGDELISRIPEGRPNASPSGVHQRLCLSDKNISGLAHCQTVLG